MNKKHLMLDGYSFNILIYSMLFLNQRILINVLLIYSALRTNVNDMEAKISHHIFRERSENTSLFGDHKLRGYAYVWITAMTCSML